MKKFLLIAVFIVLAGAVSFFVCQKINKKEIKKISRDYSAEISHDMGKKKTMEDVYFPLDPTPQSLVYKISNTEIANLIKLSLPLNQGLKNPNKVHSGRDTITWNCKAYGFASNPRIEVTDRHFMWVKAKELLEFMKGVSGPIEIKMVKDSASVVPDPESVDLTQQELKMQEELDSLKNSLMTQKKIIEPTVNFFDKEISLRTFVLGIITFIGIMCICFFWWKWAIKED